MNNPILISICIRVYNSERFIEPCLRSIFEQTYDNLEILIVDDKTPDASIEIVKKLVLEYPQRLNQLRIIEHEVNLGAGAALRTAVTNARGEFIALIDSDDWVEKDSIELLVKKQIASGADIVSGGIIVHYPNREEILEEPAYIDKEDMMMHMIELTVDHVLWRRIIRASLFLDNKIEAIDGIDYGEDHHILPRLIYYANKCESIGQVIYHYRLHKTESVPYSKQLKMWDSECAAITILLDFFTNRNDKCKEKLLGLMAKHLDGYLGLCFSNRDRKRYNEIASKLYAMDDSYLSQVWFRNSFERKIYRYYEFRYLYRALLKLLPGLD